MAPWQSFVLEMTKALLSWPTVALIVFLVLIRKAGAVSALVDSVADRVGRVSISRSGVHIETVPRGRDFVEELPYRERPAERRKDVR